MSETEEATASREMDGIDYVQSILVDSIEAQRRGEQKPSEAQAISNGCGKLINTFKLRLEVLDREMKDKGNPFTLSVESSKAIADMREDIPSGS